MKSTLTFLTAVLIPLQFLSAGLQKPVLMETTSSLSIPDQFLTSATTKTSEWGCPVNDHIKTNSRAAAVEAISDLCQGEILKAAQNTAENRIVISIKTIWPDLQISEADGGYKLTGTIFFETLTMRR